VGHPVFYGLSHYSKDGEEEEWGRGVFIFILMRYEEGRGEEKGGEVNE
jgi:hypothetical protein